MFITFRNYKAMLTKSLRIMTLMYIIALIDDLKVFFILIIITYNYCQYFRSDLMTFKKSKHAITFMILILMMVKMKQLNNKKRVIDADGENVIDDKVVDLESSTKMNTEQCLEVMGQVLVSNIDDEEHAVQQLQPDKKWKGFKIVGDNNFCKRYQAMDYTTRLFPQLCCFKSC